MLLVKKQGLNFPQYICDGLTLLDLQSAPCLCKFWIIFFLKKKKVSIWNIKYISHDNAWPKLKRHMFGDIILQTGGQMWIRTPRSKISKWRGKKLKCKANVGFVSCLDIDNMFAWELWWNNTIPNLLSLSFTILNHQEIRHLSVQHKTSPS